MFKYLLVINEDFKKFDIWGNLNLTNLNSRIINDDFIRDNNLRELEKLGAVKIIPIGNISVNNTKNLNSLYKGQRKTRKNLLEVASSDVDKEETTIPEI